MKYVTTRSYTAPMLDTLDVEPVPPFWLLAESEDPVNILNLRLGVLFGFPAPRPAAEKLWRYLCQDGRVWEHHTGWAFELPEGDRLRADLTAAGSVWDLLDDKLKHIEMLERALVNSMEETRKLKKDLADAQGRL